MHSAAVNGESRGQTYRLLVSLTSGHFGNPRCRVQRNDVELLKLNRAASHKLLSQHSSTVSCRVLRISNKSIGCMTAFDWLAMLIDRRSQSRSKRLHSLLSKDSGNLISLRESFEEAYGNAFRLDLVKSGHAHAVNIYRHNLKKTERY